jgi:protein TonB
MRRFLRFDLFLIFAFVSLTMMGQGRRVGTVNPLSPDKSSYTMYYEFEQVEVQPQFPGGEHGLVNFINDTREYPYIEYVNHRQGRVLCSFIIGADGQVTHVKVFRSSGYRSFDEEAVRVIKKMPRWEAGSINNVKVNVRCILPIAFRL